MLEIANLSHTYANGTVALDDVNLTIPRGMFGLLGPNGAGKSTLMRTVATLQDADRGHASASATSTCSPSPERLRRTLGYLPQDFGVYPRVSAYDMLDHMAVLKGIAAQARAQERRSRPCSTRPTSGRCARRRWPASPAACASASASPRR